MPALSGFSDNAFKDRSDVEAAAISLLQSLCQYQSHGGARIKIPVATGAHFDETAAQLEGFARPLWAIGAMLAGGGITNEVVRGLSQSFAKGLDNGTNPEHPEYWGAVIVRDQRMVEMEIIAFALLAAPEMFYRGQSTQTKTNIKAWLMTINGKDMPATNWRWFRVLSNLALIQVCGVPEDELRSAMDDDLDLLDSFYLSDGWSSDGLWDEKGRQADYYSGSFAIQFSQLIYVKFAENFDPVRCKVYRQRAYHFSKDFCHYFNGTGAAIPFGRSLTYRFAFAGFWAAAAYAEVELSSPIDSLGATKGFLLRHLRWWGSKHEIFNSDGTLSIGFTYPNMYMCEDYNSPQSVYWCMKTFVCLALPQRHPFWMAPEQEYPFKAMSLSRVMKAPMQIVCNSNSHHFMLSSGQFCPWPLKATEAKYGKFAYSSHFGFSVPTGPLIQQMAPDSTLALRLGDDDTWKVRWISQEARFTSAALVVKEQQCEFMPVLLGLWRPWKLFDVEVTTALIAPSTRWPDWHIRIHKIVSGRDISHAQLEAVEGGFAIYGRKSGDGLPIQQTTSCSVTPDDDVALTSETVHTTNTGTVVVSVNGISGIRSLRLSTKNSDAGLCRSEGYLLKPDSNTNLMLQRTVIPTIKSVVQGSSHEKRNIVYLASAVLAMDKSDPEYVKLWNDVPVLHMRIEEEKEEAYIRFTEW